MPSLRSATRENVSTYTDENRLPCPLSLSLFEEEIRERDEMARQRREASDDDY